MNLTEHTKIRKEKFGTVVFDTLTEKIFITDQIGGEILQLIEDGKDLPQILSTLSDNYEISFTDRRSAIYTKEMLIQPVSEGTQSTPQKIQPGLYTRAVPEMKDPSD